MRNLAWFGILGWNLLKGADYVLAVDGRIGMDHNMSYKTILEDFNNGQWPGHDDKGLMGGLRVSYEKKVTNYLDSVLQLGGDFSRRDKRPITWWDENSNTLKDSYKEKDIFSYHGAFYVDLGLQLHMGKDRSVVKKVSAAKRTRQGTRKVGQPRRRRR